MFGSPFAIGGHRGFGENFLRKLAGEPSHCPGPRENTLPSFFQACKREADFIEFDIQVTADGTPVIFHDDYIVHGNLCTPQRSLVSQVTMAEFKSMGPLMRWFKDAVTKSLVPCDQVWTCEEEADLPTFAELLQSVPEHMGLNIEIKISTSAALAETPFDEIQRVVDPIVATLLAASTSHSIAVSSFDPDVMLYFQSQLPDLLPAYPNLTCWFLSAGAREALRQDERRQSLPAAVQFAAQHRFAGVVVDSLELRRQPSVIQTAGAADLLVMTYGVENDDVDWVLQQRDLGVAGVIADDVASAVDYASATKGDSFSDASPRSDMDSVVIPQILA